MQVTTHKTSQWPFILALIAVGLNLRPPMAVIGPLLSHIQNAIPASYSFIALLTMLPILAMGLAMFFGVYFARRWGEYKTVAWALVIIGLSNFLRYYANDELHLLFTAVTAGLGIAIIQSLVPGIIKNYSAAQVPFLMGLYITAIMGGAALAAGAAPYIAEISGDWQFALAVWSALSALALGSWFMIRAEIQPQAAIVTTQESFASYPRAWLLGIFFGLGTASYTCLLAWLPPYFVELGVAETHAGLLLSLLTGVEVISGLIVPLLASYNRDRRKIMTILLSFVLIGFIGLTLAATTYTLLWIILLGLGIGGMFPLSLIITLDHLESPQRAGQLTAFVQGIGYIIAAFSPLVAGYIKDITHNFTEAWLLLGFLSLVMIGMAWFFNPTHYAQNFKIKRD